MIYVHLRFFQTRFLGPKPTTVGVLAAVIVVVQIHIKQVGSAAYVMSTTVFALAPVFLVYLAVELLTRGRPRPRLPAMPPEGELNGRN